MYVLIFIVASLLLFATTSETASKEPSEPKSCLEPVCKVEEPEPLTVPDIIRQESKQAGLPVNTMLAIAKAESDFRPHVKNDHSTATGVYQILIGTWNWFECEGKRTNAHDNIECAMEIATNTDKGGGLHHWNASSHNWK